MYRALTSLRAYSEVVATTIIGVVVRLYPVAIVAVLWQVISVWLQVSYMPTIPEIAAQFWLGLQNMSLADATALTLGRAMGGFLLGSVVGVALGCAFGVSQMARATLEPTFAFFYPVPRIALYPVVALVLGFGTNSKIALATLESLFPVAVATYAAIRSTPRNYIWAAKNMGVGAISVILRVRVPAAISGIGAGMRVALPIALVITVVAEMVGGSSGVGYFINYAAASFDYSQLYAGVVAIGVVGYLMDLMLSSLISRVLHWEVAG